MRIDELYRGFVAYSTTAAGVFSGLAGRGVSRAALALVFGLAWSVGARAELPEVIELAAGAQRLVDVKKPVTRLAVGQEEVAAVKVINARQFLLQGNQPGVTSLLVWSRGERSATRHEIRVNKPVAAFPDGEAGGLTLKSAGDLSLLGGTAPGMQQHATGRLLAAHGSGDDKAIVADRSVLPYSGEVQIDVRVVEFSRKILNKAGLSLLSNKSGFSFGSYAPGSLNKVQMSNGAISVEANLPINQALNLLVGAASENLLGVLSVLEGNGFARTLARPTLVAQSGRDADFLAGGEFPVPVPQALGQTTIQFKPYGIRLQVSPTVLAENRIALTVSPEVSDLNFENGIAINGVTVPSLSTRRATTSIELGNGESFVIGGLVSQNLMRNVNKVPGLGDIPVLGAFFKSISVSREDKELLFIVTPRLVRPLAVGTELGPMPGEAFAAQERGLWREWLFSDDEQNARYTGFSK